MKAVIIKAQGVPGLMNIKEQRMRSGYVKVKTVAVAVNPSMFVDSV
jgi:NADPH:quinone reductase-like Zn-dependent oxidoreductase